MKKILRITAVSAIIAVLTLSVFCVNCFAAASSISVNKSSVTVGGTVNVTVTLNAGEAMYGVGCVINYDSNILEYKSGSASGGAGVLKIVESPSGETKVSYSLTFNAKAAGNAAISVSDCYYGAQGAEGATEKSMSGSSSLISVNNPTASANANLKAISLSAGNLSPAFSQNVTSYTATVRFSVDTCKVYATAADSKAKVTVSGDEALKVGDNVRTITVTAADGSQKNYTVTIKRLETDLEPLEVNLDGQYYKIVADLSSVELLKGFTATTTQVDGLDVQVATDEGNNYKIFYLTSPDDSTPVPYIFDEELRVYKKLPYMIQGENAYIFSTIPDGTKLPEGYVLATRNIAGFDVSCYTSDDVRFSDFYYVYCFSNGQFGFYRYDTVENVIQRAPEVNLSQSKTTESKGIIAKLKNLSRNAKIIILLFGLIVIALIAMTIYLLVNSFGKRRYKDVVLTDADFDDIVVNDQLQDEELMGKQEE